ncbi:UvrD-helicase domain-containing protein [Caballeronia sp. LP006]|jgi:DNA helicase-2/ATP-dependent DNA helicase PcrA|uniref:UvrD-helicase domain-containing protein n=1 Tax=unclassified Caballeronia TaxID=2646786 RepID=UPI001FD4E6FA|nr:MULTISPECIES: UvrD-helicase domain-containing protein [unclassified Caballeronia]MDR5772021.1 UvrD-helicase domain-containing protein [Caballeronia sp. LZ002]MDR5804501.1 UvrD-helicase domain-containing protein [Caballeronia sp. LZ001]MDR5831662.1 UvrD-helicase domain-containing protein [Caballeronia sp. LP006]MDR5847455.1 UvrD-helicase domain-containing protein [Caballeronia sp. LZ003]
MPDLLANLNPEQLAAVTLPNEPALILAGAGSGKTRVLITRIAWLIQQGYASPPTILAVTFTNKAAREMMSRLSALLPIDTRGMWIGTFHGLCNRMLRAHYRDAGLPQTFQILDTADQLSAIKRLMKGLNVDDEKYPAKNLQYFINNAKEQGLRPKDVDATDAFNRKFVELYEAYDQQCQREGVVDFPELLLRCHELLAFNAPLRAHYQARFRNILVDEFQDTNKLQYAWLKQLAGESNAIFAVGDDDQSIYAFRGANVGNMHDFEREFRVRNLIKLEQNYRSHGHILDTANFLIANNSRRLGKNLRTDAGHGEPVRVYEAATDSQEAGWIVEEIKALINTGLARGEIAVLYRSNAQSRTIEHTLVNAGIAYRVYGGLRFFERQEVKHALAYLRLIDNPNDDTAFARVVNFPTRGIGARSIEQLADAARLYNCSMAAAVPYVTGKAGSSLGAFATLVAKMRAETQQMSLPETVEYVVRASGLAAFYETEREGQDRLENLQEVVNAAAAFVSEEGYGLDTPARSVPLRPGATAAPEIVSEDGEIEVLDAPGIADPAQNPDTMTPLAGFLSHASLEAGDNQAQAGQDAVQLMTVHAAKGLEFTAVFITGLEEGLFPHENSAQETDGLEEERRLAYVAITRAKERLYLSFAQSRMLHGQTRYNIRSRFFDELPEGSLKWLTPKIEPGARWGGRADNAGWGRDWFARPGQERGGSAYGGSAASAPALPSFANEQRAAESGFKVGQAVFHTKFGEGTVIGLEGSGGDARAQVRFKRHGEKWLALAVAKLQAVE